MSENMQYCRTGNVIRALQEWLDEPGTDDALHEQLIELCAEVVESFSDGESNAN